MDLGRRNTVKLEGGMSSMTDLVFLLLIFFIIMATMAQDNLPVDIPTNKSAEKSKTNPAVQIGISENNMYFFESENPTFYTFDEMVPILEKKMEESSQEALKISGDKIANYETVFNVIALAKQRQWKPALAFK